MLGIAKGTLQVAATETHKDRRCSRMVTFALKGKKDFVDLEHSWLWAANQSFAGRRP